MQFNYDSVIIRMSVVSYVKAHHIDRKSVV